MVSRYSNKPRELPILVPTKITGQNMVKDSYARDPAWDKALDEEAKWQTEEFGVTVTKETVMFNFTVGMNTFNAVRLERVKERYYELEKEMRNGQKLYVPYTYKKLGASAEG